MAKVFISFEAENDEDLVRLVRSYAARHNGAPSWLGKEQPPPSSPELLADQATLTDPEYDAKHSNAPAPAAPAPAAPKTRKPRAVAPPPAPAPEPEPEPNGIELPALETLKQVITTAVRLAQKGEGSKKILELLPGFKDKTGLDFVMNAEDRHRAPLYDLVVAADIPVV
jgi:hypothetical protein